MSLSTLSAPHLVSLPQRISVRSPRRATPARTPATGVTASVLAPPRHISVIASPASISGIAQTPPREPNTARSVQGHANHPARAHKTHAHARPRASVQLRVCMQPQTRNHGQGNAHAHARPRASAQLRMRVQPQTRNHGRAQPHKHWLNLTQPGPSACMHARTNARTHACTHATKHAGAHI